MAPKEPPRYHFPIQTWISATEDHPDSEFRNYVLEGISAGFDICVDKSENLARSKCNNLPTNVEQKIAITDWVRNNIDKNAIWGPFKGL